MSPSRVILFEDSRWSDFLPLTYIRPLWDLLCGRGALRERVECLLSTQGENAPALQFWCRPEMEEIVAEQGAAPVRCASAEPALLLNSRAWWRRWPAAPNGPAVGIAGAEGDAACVWADAELAARLTADDCLNAERWQALLDGLPHRDVSDDVVLFRWPWELVLRNEDVLRSEGAILQPRQRGRVDDGSYILNPEAVSLGEGARVKPCVVIDAEEGPVWIGAGATVMPHCVIQGPACIGDQALLQPGAVVHAGTTIGRRCKVGGEIEASIMQEFSNKQHDGFLGHSYVGSWVNIAADCINSDLKNTYGSVRVPLNGREVDTGEMFVGMLIGDYSKTGINVSFPTGAVVGFCSSVFRPLSPKFVPSFSWIDAGGERPFDVDRGVEIARKVMARRQRELTPALERRFRAVAEESRHIEVP